MMANFGNSDWIVHVKPVKWLRTYEWRDPERALHSDWEGRAIFLNLLRVALLRAWWDWGGKNHGQSVEDGARGSRLKECLLKMDAFNIQGISGRGSLAFGIKFTLYPWAFHYKMRSCLPMLLDLEQWRRRGPSRILYLLRSPELTGQRKSKNCSFSKWLGVDWEK